MTRWISSSVDSLTAAVVEVVNVFKVVILLVENTSTNVGVNKAQVLKCST